MSQLMVENTILRKILGMNFTDAHLKAVQDCLEETELNFFDNFCISRRDLEQKAIHEYEKVLLDRRDSIEN